VMLPDQNGFEVCRQLRSEGHNVGVLFLTAKDSTEDKIAGLTIGGDDYMTKPFSLEELVARLRALLRRTGATQVIPDDENSISDLIATSLRFVGFDVRTAATGSEALRIAEEFKPHALILDVMLPDQNGFEVCRQLRQDGHSVGVLFLTAKDTVEDKITGLTIGGDDYVTKPFSLEELVARLRALLRRIGVTTAESDDEKVRFADLELDEATHEVRRAGNLIDLSPTEFLLLRYLMINADRVVSKSQILDHVWQYDFRGDAGIVETYISYLRKKIDSYEPALIHTVRGVGYRLRLPARK